MKRFLKNEFGQSMTEYILIIVLVIIAVIVALHFFGGSVKNKFFTAGDQVQTEGSTVTTSSTPANSTLQGSSGSISGGSEETGSKQYGTSSSSEINMSTQYFGNEEAIQNYEKEKQKAWLKTIVVFAVAGAVLLILIFMTIERIRMIKKQMIQQQEMDDYRYGRRRKPITFKKTQNTKKRKE